MENWAVLLFIWLIYRPGKENAVAGAISRVCKSVKATEDLLKLNKLRHSGISRMLHVIRSRNLPSPSRKSGEIRTIIKRAWQSTSALIRHSDGRQFKRLAQRFGTRWRDIESIGRLSRSWTYKLSLIAQTIRYLRILPMIKALKIGETPTNTRSAAQKREHLSTDAGDSLSDTERPTLSRQKN